MNQALALEIERETDNTRRMLNGLQDEHLDWQPHEKSWTVARLAGHIVELHNWVGKALSLDGLDFATTPPPFQVTSVQQLKDALEEGLSKNLVWVNSVTHEELAKVWTMRAGDRTIASMPKAGAFRFLILNHLIHHRGQLSVYLRLMGLKVPGMYGPSADDRNL